MSIELRYDWMGCPSIIGDAVVTAPIVQAPNGPYAAGSTPVYTGQIVDADGTGIPAASLASLTLSIVDVLSGAVVLPQTNILNTGRGAVDAQGNLTITLLAADTSMAEIPGDSQVERCLVIDFTGTGTIGTGRHQVNFQLLALAGA